MPKETKKTRMLRVRKETILKILIILGIIAILVSAYIQYGIPYLHERQLEKLDVHRVNDLTTLNTEIESVLKASPQADLGAPNTVYISVPSTQADCSDLDLPTLAPNWSYHCVATSTLQNTDGTGWLPIDFNKLSSTTILTIPIDPINNTNASNYYSFVTSSGTSTEFAITSSLSTNKYLDEYGIMDGTYPSHYELGSNLNLWKESQGLLLYMPSINFQNPEQIVKINNLNFSSEGMTLTMWINLTRTSVESYELIEALNSFVLYGYDTHPDLDIGATIFDSSGKQIFAGSTESINYNQWHQVGLFYGNLEVNGVMTPVVANIIDGQIIDPAFLQKDNLLNFDEIIINNRKLYQGEMKDLEIYNSSFSPSQLENEYVYEKTLGSFQ